MSREQIQRSAEPHLVADVTMYETDRGGRRQPAVPGWGCPAMLSQDYPLTGWDVLLLLRDQPIAPGEKRRLGFYFLSGETGAALFRKAGRFYLWEGGFIGEARVVAD